MPGLVTGERCRVRNVERQQDQLTNRKPKLTGRQTRQTDRQDKQTDQQAIRQTYVVTESERASVCERETAWVGGREIGYSRARPAVRRGDDCRAKGYVPHMVVFRRTECDAI